jgi:hypothetical protein
VLEAAGSDADSDAGATASGDPHVSQKLVAARTWLPQVAQ